MSNIDPTREQFDVFKELPRDTPIRMLNLIRLNERAQYQDGRQASGREAYTEYGRESGPIFNEVGGTVIWQGRYESLLIGPTTEYWDIAFIAAYPDAAAFLSMVTNPKYQAIVFHRQAAVADSRLIRFADNKNSEAAKLFG